jgi:hypothetical protein
MNGWRILENSHIQSTGKAKIKLTWDFEEILRDYEDGSEWNWLRIVSNGRLWY